MSNFDYQNMNPEEFEKLAKDIIETMLGSELESYYRRPDQKIHFYKDNFERYIMIEYKKYNQNYSFGELYNELSILANTIDSLRIQDYIPDYNQDYLQDYIQDYIPFYLVTNYRLTTSQKKRILGLFKEYMPDESNIVDGNAIKSFFENKKNYAIIYRYLKVFDSFPGDNKRTKVNYKIINYRPIYHAKKKEELVFMLDDSFFNNLEILWDSFRRNAIVYNEIINYYLSAAIQTIKKLRSDLNNSVLKADLIYAIQYYLLAIKEIEGNQKSAYILRELAYLLIYAAICAGCEKPLSALIKDYYNEYKKNKGTPPNLAKDFYIDFNRLYLGAADKSLFQNYDIDTALSFYELTGTLWSFDDSGKPDNTYRSDTGIDFSVPRGLTKAEIAQWEKKTEAFQNIMQENSKVDFTIFNFNGKDKLCSQFNECIKLLKGKYKSAIDNVNALIDTAGYQFDSLNDKSRMSIFMISAIRKRCAAELLLLLSDDYKNVPPEYKENVLQIAKELTEDKYTDIQKWANEVKNTGNNAQVLLEFMKTSYYSDMLNALLQVEPNDTESAYYTTFKTFSYMLPESCKDVNGEISDDCGKLSVMNMAYMNDPNEGIVFRKWLYGAQPIPKEASAWKELKAPYVFIKCFTSMIDYLPMWQMYGDSARGVCLIMDLEENTSLYHVCYLNKTKNGYTVRKDDNRELDCEKIEVIIKDLQTIFNSLQEEKDRIVFDKIIDSLSYLFKENSYSYEQETRILYIFKKSSPLIKHTKQDPPKLFVTHDNSVKIKKIILGPKFDNITETMPFLTEQLEILSEVKKYDQPKVVQSEIEFR